MSAPVTFTARQVETVLGIRQATLRKWVERGHVRKPMRNQYVVADIFTHCRKLAADQLRSDTCA